MSKNSIRINGDKLREALEAKTGLSIYEVAIKNGFSKNFIAQAIREGKASPSVQIVAEKCGVSKDEYIYTEPTPAPERAQISIDDIESIKRDELKAIIKEAVVEALNSLNWRLDPKSNTITFFTEKEAKR